MPYPYPIPILVVAAVAALSGLVTPWILRARQATKVTHTTTIMRDIAVEATKLPSTATVSDLITRLSSANVDWNSTWCDGTRIYDAWGTEIRINIDRTSGRLRLVSAGRDREYGTDDDLLGESAL